MCCGKKLYRQTKDKLRTVTVVGVRIWKTDPEYRYLTLSCALKNE